jgi:hypothetical protein
MKHPTRRTAMLAALAGLAVPLPGEIAVPHRNFPAGAGADPFYAAIQAQRRAWANFEASVLEDRDPELAPTYAALDMAFSQTDALAATVPTTLAGVVALLEYLHRFESVIPPDDWFDGLPGGFETKVRESVRVVLKALA